jgi:alpha-1,3-rhamnosyl/mannosyltransferase
MNRLQGKVALDLGALADRPAGIGTYAHRLALALGDLLGEGLILLGVRPEADLTGLPDSVTRLPYGAAPYQVWLQRRADAEARRAGAAITHYVAGFAPLLSRQPIVITVHDISLLRHPRTHPLPRLATLPVSLAAIARAAAIVVPSRWTQRELLRGLRVSPRRVTVIEHAPTLELADGSAAAAILERFGLAGAEYLVHVGTLEPRKNISRLVAAFERVAETRPGLRLVLAGAPGWHYAPIRRRIESSPLAERIVLTGYVPVAEAAALTAASQALCYVSIHEGFGMPVLDAMALGTPVVCSNRTAMPETAAGAAVLVDPRDVGDIARGIERALATRDSLSAAGLQRASVRRWADVAVEHLEVYRSVLSASVR